MEESIRVIINGKKRTYSHDVNPNEIMADILLSMPNLNHWSYEALKRLYIGIVELIVESLKKRKFQATFINKYFPKNKPDLLRKIYEFCLTSEGLSLLPGFGFTNRFGDKLSGNPEIHSILKGGNLIGKER